MLPVYPLFKSLVEHFALPLYLNIGFISFINKNEPSYLHTIQKIFRSLHWNSSPNCCQQLSDRACNKIQYYYLMWLWYSIKHVYAQASNIEIWNLLYQQVFNSIDDFNAEVKVVVFQQMEDCEAPQVSIRLPSYIGRNRFGQFHKARYKRKTRK